ncbi:MAG: benzoate/H(+) symporter BenE family transporter [Sulfitobacter sp.]
MIAGKLPPASCIATGFVVAVVGFFSSFPIVLQGLAKMGADAGQSASGLMLAAVSMGLTAIVISIWFRNPISVAWSTPGAALLVVSITPEGGLSEAVGAFIVAALLYIIAGVWRPIARFAAAVPVPLAQAMLAGVLLPICMGPFRALADIPQYIIPIFLAWLLAGQVNKLAAVPAAVLVTAFITLYTGGLPDVAATGLITRPVLVTPTFSLTSAIGIGVPLFIVTMATQNIPGMAIVRSYGYTPPPGPLFASVGVASLLTAPFGAFSTCLAAITTAMCADPDAHPDRDQRYWAAVMAGVFYCLFGLFAGLVTAFAALAPPMVVASLAGLALVNVLAGSTQAALAEPADREAAIVTLLITASGITLFDLGAPVWGLLIGGGVYLIRRNRSGG